MSALLIRAVGLSDAPRLAEIYAPYIEGSVVSFELTAPDAEEMASRIARISTTYPWLVAESDGRVIGYAYACENRSRPAYRWGVEVTIYLDQAARGLGIGRRLYSTLFSILREQGYINAYGIITLPNPASVGIHEALGFVQAGVFRHAGFKNGSWLDVGWYQLTLSDLPDTPSEPRLFENFPAERLNALLAAS
jgi:L-amino acid N-acyltransferase YncA